MDESSAFPLADVKPYLDPVTVSLEAKDTTDATLAAAPKVAPPATSVALEVVELAVERWFSSYFSGSVIASAPGAWNILLDSKNNLIQVIRNHASQ